MRLNGLFRTRGPERDRNTDGERRDRLCAAIEAIEREVRFELEGIRGRYEVASGNAGFLFEAIENDESQAENRLDRLSASMTAYELRIGELSRQLDFLGSLRKRAAGLSGAAQQDAGS